MRSFTRRGLLQRSALVSAGAVVAACGGGDEPAPTNAELPPTPGCDDGDEPTLEQTEGPFYTPDTPRRTDLTDEGVKGERLVVTGAVADTACRPIARALVDFWQADGEGVYDNEGYRLRGHQFTDARGRFKLTTVVPGRYPGRTRHIHVKVQRPDGPVLTTQLYFPGEQQNEDDGIFDEALVMDVRGQRATFDFVLA